jgi:pimeloyl-ACP methyl ester carboxylesterase
MEWIFLRGLVREQGHWSGFLEQFSARFPEAKIHALDIPGAGQRWGEQSLLSLEEVAEVLKQSLPSKSDKPRFVFAISLGAMVGSVLLQRWPDSFQGAVFLNTSFRGFSPFWHRLRPSAYGSILQAVCSPSILEREKIILSLTSREGSQRQELATKWAAIQEARPVSRSNALRQILSAARFRPDLEPPKVPLLILNGAGDRLVNPKCSVAIAHAWNSPLLVHPTAGHDLTLDEPHWVLDQVGEWLSKAHKIG